MKKTFAFAALLAATAFTPALAQEEPREARMAEGATAQEPTPIPQRVQVQMAQRERGERGDGGQRPQWNGGQANGGQGNADQGRTWQRPQQTAPVYQAPVQQAPVQQTQQQAPVQRQWNRGNGGGQGSIGQGWQGGQRPDWSAQRQNGGQPGWNRQAPPVTAAPTPQQPQGNWQRRDTWQNGGQNTGQNRDQNNGAVVQRQDNRSWNGQRGNQGWQNGQRDERRNEGAWNGQRRNDTWRNDGRNEGWRNNGQWNGNSRNDSWRNNNRYDQRNQWQNQYRDWNRSWSRDWRRDQRYDWQRYRYSNRSLFQGNRYYAPYGWDYGYRRFSIGFSLSYLLYDQQYWIDDPYNYRLPPVYGPYRWVRYYDDVLLVDLRSGQVVDAIYDFFW